MQDCSPHGPFLDRSQAAVLPNIGLVFMSAGSLLQKLRVPCIEQENLIDFFTGSILMASVLKKRRKKMRKHKYKKLRRRQKFLRRKT